MFERYTEKARRVVFFARYEASQYGSPAIEPQHLLLGLVREDQALLSRFLPEQVTAETIRSQIEEKTLSGFNERISTSVELPLSNSAKKVFAYAHQESDALSHRRIGPEHLLLGLLREETLAAKVLKQNGVDIDVVRQAVCGMTDQDADMDDFEKYKERFAKSTMRVFKYAMEESRRREQNNIALEHMIDALAMKEMDLFNVILAKTGVELGELRALFKTRIDSIPQNKGTDIYIAPGVIDLFRHAQKAARAANRERIVVADLFIALVQGEQKMLHDIMLAFGANLEVMLENAKHIYEAYDQAAVSAAKTWLDELDAGDPNVIWSQSHPLFKFFWSDARWLSFQNIKVYFGKVISRNLQSIAYSETMAGVPDGEYYTIRYQTSFENKRVGKEEIFLMRDEAEWKIIGYVVA